MLRLDHKSLNIEPYRKSLIETLKSTASKGIHPHTLCNYRSPGESQYAILKREMDENHPTLCTSKRTTTATITSIVVIIIIIIIISTLPSLCLNPLIHQPLNKRKFLRRHLHRQTC